MLQTLVHIPNEVAGLTVFGFGWLLLAWAVASVLLLAWLVRKQGFNGDTLGYIPLLLLVGAAIAFLLPRLCEPEGLPIRGYGVMLLFAVASGVALTAWRAHRVGVDPESIYTLSFWIFASGIVGARLFYVIQKWPQFRPVYDEDGLGALLIAVVNMPQGGLVIYGAIIGGFIGLVICIKRLKMPVAATLDLFAPGLALGIAIGRIGCLLNGCCYGGLCELPWAVTFPAFSPPHAHQVERGQAFLHGLKIVDDQLARAVISEVRPDSPAARAGLSAGQRITAINGVSTRTVGTVYSALLYAEDARGRTTVSITTTDPARTVEFPVEVPLARSEPIHPTQIYSALNGLLICAVLLFYTPYARRDGEVVTLVFTLYPISRFLLEIIRTDEASFLGTGLTISQNVSLLVVALAAVAWWKLPKKAPAISLLKKSS